MHQHPNVAAIEDGEDSAGRMRVRLQRSTELVDRCFEIADLFVAKAESRGDIRVGPTLEEVTVRNAILKRLESDVSYGRSETETWDIDKVVERANAALARIGADAAEKAKV